MARVLTYNRPVDVMVLDSFDCGSGWLGSFPKVKEEVDDSKEPIDEFPDKENTSAFCSNSNNLSGEVYKSNGIAHVRDPDFKTKLRKFYKLRKKHTSYDARVKNVGEPRRNKWANKKRVSSQQTSRKLSRIKEEAMKMLLSQCHICFMKFDTPPSVYYHYRCYMSTAKHTCSICNLTVSSKKMLNFHCRSTHNLGKTSNRFQCECHFCGQKFVLKCTLQSHLFHFHNDEIYFRNETPTKLIQNDEITNRINTSKLDRPPGEKRDWKYSPTKEHLPADRMETECTETKLNSLPEPSFENKCSPKKMRQTTLTEFITFTSPKKASSASISKTPAEELEEKDIKSSPEKLNQSLNSQSKLSEIKPFVQIHIPPEEFTAQLSKRRSQRLMSDGSKYWVRRSTRFSMRLSNQGDDPSNLEIMSSAQQSLELNKPALNTQSSANTDSKLVIQYNCKKCSIPLVKCDAKATNPPKADPQKAIAPAKQQKRSRLPKLLIGGHLMLKELEVSLERLPTEKIGKALGDPEPVTNNQVHSTETFVCKVCDRTFCSKEEKKQHMKATHTAYMSSICNARYTFKHKLIQHYLRQHYLFKRNECCVCGEPCSDRMALRRHLLLHCIKIIQSKQDSTPVNVEVTCKSYHKTNKCSGCGKSFWLYSCLQQHQMNCQKYKRIENNENDAHVTKGKLPRIQLRDERKEDKAVGGATSPNDSSNDSLHQNLPATAPSADYVRKTQITHTSSSNINNQNVDPTILQNQHSQANILAESIRFTNTNTTQPSSSTVKANDAKTKYYCDVCGRQYQTYKNLQQHLRLFTNMIGEPCNVCGTVFSSIRLLRAHFNSAHIPEIVQSYNYHCSFCNQGFCKKDSLRMHELHLHSRQLMPVNADTRAKVGTACKVCNLIFECHDRFEEHNMYYDKDQMFSCSFCGRYFRGMYMLHHHNKLVHYPQFTTTSYNYSCGTCGEGFNHETHFYAHKVHVHSVNPLSPDLFHKASPDKKSMAATDKSVTDKLDIIVRSTEPTFMCDVCDMTFNNSKELAYHESQFSDDGSYLCDQCSKRFRSLVFLTKHQVLTHSTCEVINEFMCNVCKEVFTSKVSLTCHEKHSGHILDNTLSTDPTNVKCNKTSDKTCSVCKVELKSSTDLVDHVLQYANHGNYDCDTCHRKFYYSTHFEEHKLTHLAYHSSPPHFSCGICKVGYPSIAAANSHTAHLHKHRDLSTAAARKVINALELKKSDHRNVDISAETTQTLKVNEATAREKESVGALDPPASNEQSSDSKVSENIKADDLKAQETAKKPLVVDLENKNQGLKCDICNLIFINKKELYTHCQRFKNKGDYICEFCGAKFVWESLFSDHHRKHIYEMTGVTLEHSCPICDEKYPTAVGAQAHIAHCHNSSEQSLETKSKHIEQISEKQPEPQQSGLRSECEEIQIIDITEDYTTNNADRIIQEKNQSQSSASGEVKILEDTLHETDNGNSPLENICNQSRTTLTIRTEEINIVNEEYSITDNYTCPVCLNTFMTLPNFQKHFREVHSKVTSEYRSRNYSTQLLKVTPETQGIACVICNAVFSNPVGFKKHLNAVHMPRMNFVDNMKKRFVRIIKKIPLVPHARPTATVETNATDHEKIRGYVTLEEPHTSVPNPSKKLCIPKDSEVKQQNNNVGKLKVKDFAKIIDRPGNAPKFEINKKITSTPTDKYVILQPETRSEIYFATYMNNLSKNGAQNL